MKTKILADFQICISVPLTTFYLFYGVSYYFSKIFTEVALEEKIANAFTEI